VGLAEWLGIKLLNIHNNVSVGFTLYAIKVTFVVGK
jgi:hypothetical protein